MAPYTLYLRDGLGNEITSVTAADAAEAKKLYREMKSKILGNDPKTVSVETTVSMPVNQDTLRILLYAIEEKLEAGGVTIMMANKLVVAHALCEETMKRAQQFSDHVYSS